MTLPEEDRRRIGQRLLESAQRQSPEEIAREWDEEALRRVEAAERGEAQARDWDEAIAGLRAKHALE